LRLAREEAFRQAELNYDAASARAILADEFVGTWNHGEQVNKDQFLSLIGDKAGPPRDGCNGRDSRAHDEDRLEERFHASIPRVQQVIEQVQNDMPQDMIVTGYGARPIDGFALQTKISVRCFLPMIFEPFPGEIVAVGAELTDSDYGDGFLTLNGILERMWRTNLATTTDVLKQVHLGKRLPQNIRLSDETYRLDSKAMSSLINDLASNVLGPGAVNEYLNFIRQANEQKIDAHAITGWIKKNLNKGEGEKVLEKFNSPDVQFLPAAIPRGAGRMPCLGWQTRLRTNAGSWSYRTRLACSCNPPRNRQGERFHSRKPK
jgi:hypothetical protein